MRETVKRLDEMCDAASVQASWYLKDLATGASAHRLGGVPVPSASTRKISIMMAALAAVYAGKLALDQKVTIDARYQDNDSGTFQHLTPGFWITLRDAVKKKLPKDAPKPGKFRLPDADASTGNAEPAPAEAAPANQEGA